MDDGAYLVAKLLVEMARMNAQGLELTQLIEPLEQALESKEYRLHILEEDFTSYGKNVLDYISFITEKTDSWEIVSPNYEGLRVRSNNQGEEGWFLLRMSLHDQVMPLNVESQTEGGVSKIMQKIRHVISPFEGLDISALKN